MHMQYAHFLEGVRRAFFLSFLLVKHLVYEHACIQTRTLSAASEQMFVQWTTTSPSLEAPTLNLKLPYWSEILFDWWLSRSGNTSTVPYGP